MRPITVLGKSRKQAALKTTGPHWDYMTVFSAYLDESGTHDGSPLVVVGGVVLSEKGLNDLQKAWRNTLVDYGIKVFHSKNCDAGRGEFDGWAPEKSRLFSLKLSQIVSSHATDLIVCGVSPEDFHTVWEKLNLSAIGIKHDPYRILLELCWHRLGDWAKKLPPDDTLKISVELGNKRASFINDLYLQVNNDPIARALFNITEIAFVAKEYPPLQAADLLVHKVFKYHPNWGTDNMEDVLQELTGNHDNEVIALWSANEFEEFMRVRLAQDKFFRKPKQK